MKGCMGKTERCFAEHGAFFLACIMLSMFIGGCSVLSEGSWGRLDFKEANVYFNQGNYNASLRKYEQIIEKYPAMADRALFEMAMIYAYPVNKHNDYQKALECFQKLVRNYPESMYRQDSEMMIFHINNVIANDKRSAAQQSQIESLQQEVKNNGNEISTLQNMMGTLELKVLEILNLPADKILIEKGKRKMTLFSNGKVLRTYKIALGGNPNGPKERQGDNKTPEGIYFIDSRNMDSRYHLSLHISYPNEKDRKRARELGVSPGGNIMIHGIKNGYAWIGDHHAGFDWTNGCIAVTDEEIEEIERLVPDGTMVEIRP